MNNAIETIKKGGLVGDIYYDDDAHSPRDWDNLGTMVCWNRRYNLGDEQPKCDPEEYFEDIKGRITLPLYVYEHGGITISTGAFSCPWDSGQVGWIYVTKERLYREYGWKRITKKRYEQIVKYLEGEVNEYDMYLTGQCYGYCIEDEGGEELDSCWGFLGMEYVLEEMESTMKCHLADRKKQRFNKLKELIRNSVPLGLRNDLLEI